MIRYTPDGLVEVLRLHTLWLRNAEGGSRANLIGANLSRANLIGANLSRADLIGADLSGADLIGANLSRADLIGADLSGANLSRANLIGADLSRADLSGANLSRADLSRANLSRADLSGANLSRADLIGANLIGANLSWANLSWADGSDLALAMSTHLPEGPFWAWKKCKDGVIVKLLIPENARRSHGSERKCRAEFVEVLEVIGAEVGISTYDGKTKYRKGETVRPDGWDEDRWNTCGQGIHFMLTRLEAEAYT